MVKKSNTNFLSSLPEQYQKQNLSVSKINKLKLKNNDIDDSDRPDSGLTGVSRWVKNKFDIFLKDKVNLNVFLHDTISVSSEFFAYCEDYGIKITALYKDSIMSWRSDQDLEGFFVQGVFLIESDELEFICSSLFYKGYKYEDKIGFFSVVSEKNYNNYIKLRNDFEFWSKSRERNNLLVKVIDGTDISYSNEYLWEDLFLPKETKNDIKNTVESFLSSKSFYIENNLPWKRGVILHGSQGCGKTSIIKTIISNYNFKPVTISANGDINSIRNAFAYAEEHGPSLLYFEDLDYLLQRVDVSDFLNCIDGISSKNGLFVIATTNDLSKLKPNIIDRPSRFDMKIHVPLPNKSMCLSFLKKMFGNSIKIERLNYLTTFAINNKFSYAYIKEIYISCMYEAISNKRNNLTDKDIYNALDKIIVDKNILKSGKISTDKYLRK